MMRWLLLAVLVVALTAAATVSIQFLPSSTSVADGPAYPNTPRQASSGPPAKAVVEGETAHDFGVMAQKSKGRKEWVIKNEGEGDLKLEQGESSCSCTIANLEKGKTAVLKQGETTTVTLEWDTKENNGKYSQQASVLTFNDPNRQKFEFRVTGEVRPALLTVPPGGAFQFSNISNEKSQTAPMALISPDKPDLALKSVTSSKPDLLVTTSRPLTKEELETFGYPSGSGYKIDLEIKPGMPVGEIYEKLVAETDHPRQSKMEMVVTGRAVGPISVMPDYVRISGVASNKPASKDITLWVRGQDATHFDVAKSPEKLKVDIASVDEKSGRVDKDAKARRYRMTVTVPPGTVPGVIDGMIILKTDHPQAGEVKIPVNVMIRAAG